MNTIGNALKLTVFGESHSAAIGCVIDGLPAGFKMDLDAIRFELKRRAPRSSPESTERNEDDDFEILSGLLSGRTTGSALAVVFRNKDAVSGDYAFDFARPSHADLPAFIKYRGYNDRRGGGAFSGRLTAPTVFAGAVCKQLLNKTGIEVFSHIASVGGIADERFDPLIKEKPMLDPMFPLLDTGLRDRMTGLFTELRESGDSTGGTVECAVLGMPAGIGEPLFGSLESAISNIVFAVPGVHAIEFGAGFALSGMLGSEANDPILESGRTLTNNSGGVNGGLSNGMPLIFRAAFRPVPSIARPQRSVTLGTLEECEAVIPGRHDACILPRGCAVIEAAAAVAVYDLLLMNRGTYGE